MFGIGEAWKLPGCVGPCRLGIVMCSRLNTLCCEVRLVLCCVLYVFVYLNVLKHLNVCFGQHSS